MHVAATTDDSNGHLSASKEVYLDGMQKFPRADVDLYKARRLRQEHAMLKNDAKSLLSDLHAAMIAVHESARNSGTASEGQPRLISQQAPQAASSPSADAVPSAEETEPFAHIVSVEAGSPADEAGLQIGDKLCRVGTIGASPGAVNAIAAHLQVRVSLLECAP
jgi:26S proteasome non-ATPase regulatory subunit 9